jgi:hypothetical protein
MRTLRTTALVLAILSLLFGSSVAMVAETPDTTQPVGHVSGSFDVQQLPGGSFTVDDRVFQYRDYPLSGSVWRLSDPRLRGFVISDWNWDVQASGNQPVPAWGSMTISADDGTWEGTFTGVRYGDFQPVEVRAFLIGEGAYDGLCATLDITATGMAGGETWIVDGAIQPLPMSG